MILIDTGPLVAMLNRQERHHHWVCEQLSVLKPPFYTCESVISETCFILQRGRLNAQPVFDMLKRGLVLISFDLQTEHSAVGALMDKYSDLPIDLADACLVRMAEKEPEATVLTLDSDFLLYRKNTRHVIPTIMPEEAGKRIRRKNK